MASNTTHAESCTNVVPQFVLAPLAILCNVLSFIGNGTLFLTVLRHRSLRTNLNLLVLSVTAADIVSVLSSQPMDIVYIIEFPNIPFTPIGYIIWFSLYYAYLTISAYSLCAVNLDRLIAVRFPLRYKSVVRRKVIYRVILACWIYGVITFGFLTYLQLSNNNRNGAEFNSLILLPDRWLLLLFIFNLLLPIVISFMGSVYVTRITWRHKKEIDQLHTMFKLKTFEPDVLPCLSRYTDVIDSPVTDRQTIWSQEMSSSSISQPAIQSNLCSPTATLIIQPSLEPNVQSQNVSHQTTWSTKGSPIVPSCSRLLCRRESMEDFNARYHSFPGRNEHVAELSQGPMCRLSKPVIDLQHSVLTILSNRTFSLLQLLNYDLPKLRTLLGIFDTLLTFDREENVHNSNVCEMTSDRVFEHAQSNLEGAVRLSTDSDKRKQCINFLRNFVVLIIILKCSFCTDLIDNFMVASRTSQGLPSTRFEPRFTAHTQNRTKLKIAKRHRIIMALKTSRLILCLSLTFLLCTLPYFAMEIYRRSSPGPKSKSCSFLVARVGVWWLTYWNSVMNVLCYVALNTELRALIKRNILAIKMRFI